MNTPNPLIPQGSLQQQSKGKSNLRIAVFTIVAIHVVVLGGLLMQGCGDKTKTTSTTGPTNEVTALPPFPTNETPTVTATNPPNVIPSTNVPTVVATNPAPVEVVAPPAAEGRTYVVVKGDILASIAKKNGVSLKALEAANPGVVPTKLKLGQKLQIPGGGSAPATTESGISAATGDAKTYTVKPGDNLTKIAKANGTKVAEIKKLNNLKTDQVKVGQKIKLPSHASVEAAPASTIPAPAPSTTGTVASTNGPR